MAICKSIRSNRWIFYYGNTCGLTDSKCGKWMYFFNDKAYAANICTKAVEDEIVSEAKHTDADEGVACFYINVDDLKAHRRVIKFFLDNNLIRKSTKTGKYYNISFKRDAETHAGQYTSFENFQTEFKLDRFIDLKTGQWIIDDFAFERMLPPEVKLLSGAEDFEIDKKLFGVDSAFKYILLAFPSCKPLSESYKGGKMHFWRGNIPKKLLAEDDYYIITFRAVFYLKKGKTPFVKCKTSLLYGFRPMETSDVYNPKDGKWYDHYIDFDGKKVRAFPTLTLSKDDFELFKETYDIVELKVLGGCFFK